MFLTDPDPVPAPPNVIVLEAIVRQRCLAATYNRADIVIAPHILYTRNDELYVDAVTVSRNLVLAREPKVATFKLSGLGGLRVTGRDFVISDLFDRAAEKYVGTAVMAVEPA